MRHTHTMEYYSAIKKNDVLFATTRRNLENISEIRQRNTNNLWYPLYVEGKSYSKLVNKTLEADSENREPTSGEKEVQRGHRGVGK